MATVQLGFAYCSTKIDSVDIGTGTSQQLAAVASAPIMVPSSTLDMLYNFLDRAYDTTGVGRPPRVTDRIYAGQARFSVEEIYDTLDHAAREVAMRVRAEFVQPLWQTINPSSNAFDQSDKIRLLGSRVKISTAIAKRLGIYQYRDITSRGVTFSDSQPVYTVAGGELNVHGDTPETPNPSDAEATYIKLPEVTVFTNTGRLTATTTTTGTIALTGAGDTFDTTRDLHVLLKMDDGTDVAWTLISTVSDSTNISVTGVQLNSAIEVAPTDITLTWYVPAFYEMPRILEKLVVQLAAGDLFSAMGEFGHANEAYGQYQDALREFALPQYALPLESQKNVNAE